MRKRLGADVAQRLQQFTKAPGARQQSVDNSERPEIAKQAQGAAQRLRRADRLLLGYWQWMRGRHVSSIAYFRARYILDKSIFLFYTYFRNGSNSVQGIASMIVP